MRGRPVDLLVVGGGVVGTVTAALAALDHPDWTVRLVEQGRVGEGATGASAGLSFPIARTAWQAGLVTAAGAGFARLTALLPGLPLRDIDVLWILPADRLAELAGQLVGRPPVLAGASQLAALRGAYPDLAVRPDEVVVSTAERCFFAYPAALAQRLAVWLRSVDPAAVQEGVGVERVRGSSCQDGPWRAELTDGRVVAARRVITAVGPWPSGGLVPDSVLARRSRVKKVAALHLGHRPPPDAPCVVLWEDDAFVLPLTERGGCLFSYHDDTWDVTPRRPVLLTPAGVAGALAVLRSRSPELADRYAGGRAFCDGYTTDRAPLVESRDGLVEIGGCSGSGVRLAPGLAAAALSAVS